MSKKIIIKFYGQTDMGRQRTNNEDAFIAEQIDDACVLAVVIDGVGGYEGGEVAAAIAQKEISRYLHEFKNGERLELLKQAVVCANNTIFERRQQDIARSNMSCVLTSALIDANRQMIDMVHVGDTRLYQYHHGELRKLSHDHSLIGYREEMGDLTEEQAMHHPQRNVISRDVGSAKHEITDRDFLESVEFPLLPNSIFLLCSDGLTDLVTSTQIVSILETNKPLELKAQSLINAANEAGGKDNVTVVLVAYVVEEKAIPSKQIAHGAITNTEVPLITREKKEKPIKINTNNMNKFNIWMTIVITFVFLLSCVIFCYVYHIHQQLNVLYENHLNGSEKEETELTVDGVDGVPIVEPDTIATQEP